VWKILSHVIVRLTPKDTQPHTTVEKKVPLEHSRLNIFGESFGILSKCSPLSMLHNNNVNIQIYWKHKRTLPSDTVKVNVSFSVYSVRYPETDEFYFCVYVTCERLEKKVFPRRNFINFIQISMKIQSIIN
jgi:hypothetical protein